MPFEDATVISHESFAIIGLSRINGTTTLFNSPFQHQGFMRLRIARAEKHRHLSTDWIHKVGSPLIEVDMSYSQFAEFLTSANVGNGTPCTISRLNNQSIPSPPVENYFELFVEERNKAIDKCREAFKELEATIHALPMTKKAQKDLLEGLRKANMSVTDSIPFISNMFTEHMEAVTSKAKIEISAYASATVQQFGLAVLRGENPGIPAFGPPIDVKQLPDSEAG